MNKSTVYFILGFAASFLLLLSLSNLKMDNINSIAKLQMKEVTVEDPLFNEVRVLCWIMTSPENHEKAIHLNKTWLKRCNKVLFISSLNNGKEMSSFLRNNNIRYLN